jgi:hypothetical protein
MSECLEIYHQIVSQAKEHVMRTWVIQKNYPDPIKLNGKNMLIGVYKDATLAVL